MIRPEEIKAFDRYDWTTEQTDKYLKEVLVLIEEFAPLMYKAKEVIKYFHDRGHKIFAITSRGGVDKKEIDITKRRIKEEDLAIDEIIFSGNKKNG